MKRTDDYEAKYDLWVQANKVVRLPSFSGVPKFGSRKFSSYAEFNKWKREMLEKIAAGGGLKWTN